jgi:hypothetical protein
MQSIPTIKVADPDKPGDFLNLNLVDFRPGVDRTWAEAETERLQAEAALREVREKDAEVREMAEKLEAELPAAKPSPATEAAPAPRRGRPRKEKP